MAHRVNVMLDDEVWGDMQKLPRGERSKVINRAIRAYLEQQQRRHAAEQMDELRQTLPPLAEDIDVVELLRQDRARDDA